MAGPRRRPIGRGAVTSKPRGDQHHGRGGQDRRRRQGQQAGHHDGVARTSRPASAPCPCGPAEPQHERHQREQHQAAEHDGQCAPERLGHVVQPGPADRVVQRRERAQRAGFGGVVEHAQDQAAGSDPERHAPARRQRPAVRQHLRVHRRQQHRGREPQPSCSPRRRSGQGRHPAAGPRRSRPPARRRRTTWRCRSAGDQADRDQQPAHRVGVRAPDEHRAHHPEGDRHRDLGGLEQVVEVVEAPGDAGARPRRRRAPPRRPRRPAPPGRRSGSPRDAASRANGRSAPRRSPALPRLVGAAHLPCSARARGAGLGAAGARLRSSTGTPWRATTAVPRWSRSRWCWCR